MKKLFLLLLAIVCSIGMSWADDVICSFTGNQPSSDMVTVSGNYASNRGTVTYNEVTYSICVKMETSTQITITPEEDAEITLVFDGPNKDAKINGTTQTTDANGLISFDAHAHQTYRITKGDVINLFAIHFAMSDPATKTVYLDLSSFTDWENANAYLQVWDGTNNVELTKVTSDCTNDHLYSAEVADDAATLYFKRCNPADETTWNQIEKNLGTDDMLTVTDWTAGNAATYAAPSFTITYKANGGVGEDVVVDELACGDNHTVKSANTFTRSDWAFLTWKDQHGTAHNPDEVIEVSENITLWAHWETWSVYGNFDGNWKDYYFDGNTVDIPMVAQVTRSYKIKHQQTDVADVYYGNDGTMTSANCTGWDFSSSAGNAGITSTITGNYTFTLVNNTPQISVVYPANNATDEVTPTGATNNDVVGTAYTIAGGFVAGSGNNGQKLKLRKTGNSVACGANKLQIDVNDGYVITGIQIVGCANDKEKTILFTSMFADGDESTNLFAGKTSAELTLPVSTAAAQTIEVSGFEAQEKLLLGLDGAATQYNVTITITYKTNENVQFVKTITTNAEGWTSFSSSKAIAIPDGLTAYVGVLDGDRFSMTIVEGPILANTGIILKGENAANYDIYTTTKTPASIAAGTNDLIASGDARVTTPSNSYILGYTVAEGTAIYPYSGAEIPANKAFLTIPTAPAAVRIVTEPQTATAIETVEANDGVVKFIENGQLIIIKNGVRYNALGQVVR